MADKKIGDLVAATEVKDADLLILEQNGTAKNMSGARLLEYLKSKLDDAAQSIFEDIRQPTGLSMSRNGEYITVTTTLEGEQTCVSVVHLDVFGRPAAIVTDGVECVISWEGFDA